MNVTDVERAVVYTPQPGDVVVLEVDRPCSPDTAARLKATAETAFGMDVKIVVLGGAHLAGVVRGQQNPPPERTPRPETER